MFMFKAVKQSFTFYEWWLTPKFGLA